jgi:hypothetical protein
MKIKEATSLRTQTKELIDRLPDEQLSVIFTLARNTEGLNKDDLQELSAIIKQFTEKAASDVPKLPEVFPEERKYKSGDVMEYLKREFSDCLTYFGAKEDVLYQNYLRQHQPKYLKKLYNYLYHAHKKDPSKPKPEDIIKRLRDKIDEKIQSYSDEKAKEFKSIVSAKAYRKRKNDAFDTNLQQLVND